MEGNLKTEKSIVAFIDILGGKEIIMGDADKSLNTVHSCYEYTCKKLEELFSNEVAVPRVDIFSDNIILSYPFEDLEDDKQLFSFMSIIYFSAIIYIYFLNNGILVRGGISFGSYYRDELMVWGTGLVRSHELEESIAIYPRIVIDPEMSDLFEEECMQKYKVVCRDFDGIFFIDAYYDAFKYEDIIKDNLHDNYVRINNVTKDNNKKVLQKLMWLQKYLDDKIVEIEDSKRIEKE